jgi:hypothetical protein
LKNFLKQVICARQFLSGEVSLEGDGTGDFDFFRGDFDFFRGDFDFFCIKAFGLWEFRLFLILFFLPLAPPRRRLVDFTGLVDLDFRR